MDDVVLRQFVQHRRNYGQHLSRFLCICCGTQCAYSVSRSLVIVSISRSFLAIGTNALQRGFVMSHVLFNCKFPLRGCKYKRYSNASKLSFNIVYRKGAPLRPFTLTIYLHFEFDACKPRFKTPCDNTNKLA